MQPVLSRFLWLLLLLMMMWNPINLKTWAYSLILGVLIWWYFSYKPSKRCQSFKFNEWIFFSFHWIYSFFNGCFCTFWFFDPYNCLLHLHHLHHPQDPFRIWPVESLLYMCLPLHLCRDRLQQLFVLLCETQANAGRWVQQGSITDGFSGEPMSEPLYLHPPKWQIQRGVSRCHEKLLSTPQGLAVVRTSMDSSSWAWVSWELWFKSAIVIFIIK